MAASSPLLGFLEGIGGPEIILVLVIALILFGGEKLPELAKGLGKSVREFKKATAGVEEEIKRAIDSSPKSGTTTPPQIVSQSEPPAENKP